MTEIRTDHMRLALILRRAIGTGAADEYIVSDARELILAGRRLATDGADRDAIMRRVAMLMTSYGLKPLAIRGTIVLPLPSGDQWRVPG